LLKAKEIFDAKYEKVDVIRNYKGTVKEGNKIKVLFQGGKIEVSYYNKDIVKIFIGETYEESRNTRAVVDTIQPQAVDFVEEADYIKVLGAAVDTLINKNNLKISFIAKDGKVLSEDYKPAGKRDSNIFIAKANDCTAYYGFGEKGSSLNKKGKYMENYNTDEFFSHDDSYLLYKTVPFYIGVKPDAYYGIYFDNSFRSYFDMGRNSKDMIYFGATGGQIQYYFIPGEDLKEVVRKYSELTGRMELPPMWSLGYQQCRYSYYTEEEFMTIADTFRERKIPCDTLYLDIHYMDKFKVMTFNEEAFPNREKMFKTLDKKGYKVVTIVDPGVKVEDGYDVYEDGLENNHFVRKATGDIFTGEVWPGESAFPDFAAKKTREWWKDELKKFMKVGIRGIWNDMNEIATFHSDQCTAPDDAIHNGDEGIMEHAEFHNMYGMEMSRCSKEAQEELRPDTRPFSMTRATFAGGQRYSSIWTGDNYSYWEHLRMSIPMNCNLGLSGFPFIGNDVGGFVKDCSEELFIRWNQVGTFLPIYRNHSSEGTRRQEPWAYGPRAEKVAKKCIELRYKLMPYIYNEFYRASREGLPVFRPMIMEFPKDVNAIDMYSQFMFGSNILVAPVLYEGEREKLVYLPEGSWYNYFTHEKFSGGRFYTMEVPLEETLVFVKEGSIIPIHEEFYNYVGEKDLDITLEVFGNNASLELYEDDGISFEYRDGKYNLYNIEAVNKEVNVKIVHSGLDKERQFKVRYI
jgi:alpha-glucosidase